MTRDIALFLCGMIAAWNFAHTKWQFPDLSRWFYLGDFIIAVGIFALFQWMNPT